MPKYSPTRPTTDKQLSVASNGVPIYLYNKISKESPLNLPYMLGGRNLNPAMIVLIQDPKSPSVGHWVCVVYNKRRDEYYFFSSYGGRPDEEKNSFISPQDQIISGQNNNFISDGLRYLYSLGKKIHYNEFEYQKIGDKTATCGIWCVAFILSNMNPTEFFHFVKNKKLSAKDFFYLYFS